MYNAYRELFANVRVRPMMYVDTASYSNLSAFVSGCDVATVGGLLDGFHEWLVLKLDGCDEFFWTGQVLRLAFPDQPDYWHGSRLGSDEDQVAIAVLFDLLDGFLLEMESRGKRGLMHDYVVWLQSQPNYDPELVRIGRSSPKPGLH